MLTQEQLAAFEERLVQNRAPAVTTWYPGLSQDQIESLMAPFPELGLSEEARLWWGWHNGGPPNQAIIGGYARCLVPLEEALEDYVFLKHSTPLPLLALVGGRPSLYLDCVPGRPQASRVIAEEHGEPPYVAAQSLGEVVAGWEQLIDLGGWVYNTDYEGSTAFVLDQIPPELMSFA